MGARRPEPSLERDLVELEGSGEREVEDERTSSGRSRRRGIEKGVRAKLALLIAAAVVFAPGWGAAREAKVAPDAAVAARMLAPTFDEAADQTSVAVHKRQARIDARRLDGKLLPWRLPPSPPTLALLILVALAALVVLDAVELKKPDSERAPPRLVTV